MADQPPQITVSGLRKTYKVPARTSGTRAALASLVRRRTRIVEAVRDISFTIDPGDVVGFLGPNGAGKTTTLKMLAGLLHPSAGTATVAGFTPWGRNPNYLGQMALILGQRSQLAWDVPVGDSFRLNQAVYQIPERDFVTRLTELTDMLELEELLTKPSRNLSLGERMKCEFAGSLLHRPQVLFLDEPTIGLDVAMQRRIRTFVADYNERTGASVILTSHYMADVKALCQRVIVIHHGVLLYDGDLNGLVRQFSDTKTIGVEFTEFEDIDRADLDALLAPYDHRFTAAGLVITVPVADTAAVTTALLSRHNVADLTIENPPIEEVIETVFAAELPAEQTL